MQMHARSVMCTLSCACSDDLLADFIRSATVFIAWLLRRHFAWIFVIGRASVYGWYQAGREAFTPGESLIAARFVLYFLAVRSILTIPSFRDSILGPREGGCHDCKKAFVTATADVPGGAVTFIRMSVTIAHGCLDVVRFK